MKAAITEAYGPANVIVTREVPEPTLGEHDVLVAIHATPVTAGDRRLRAADFPSISVVPGRLMMGVFKPRNPIQGSMFAGRVVAVGSAVTKYEVGDRVFGSADNGAYAELIAVPEDGPIATIPEGVGYDEAAEVPYGAVTALRFLRDLGEVEAGQRILILGASGGVGRYAVQLAKQMGAHVTGVASGHNARLVRDLGADETIDYRTQDWREMQDKYDVIFDIADVSSFSEARKRLTTHGRYLTLFVSPSIIWHMLVSNRFHTQQAGFGIAMGTAEDMADIRELLAEGAIRPVIARTFPFEQIVDAHTEADHSTSGGVLVTLRAA